MKNSKPAIFALISILIVLIISCNKNNQSFQIKLKTKNYLNAPPFWGMSNIFFDKIDDNKFIIPKNCLNPEIAIIIENQILDPVYILRYTSSDTLVYIVDTDADLDFTDEKPIIFDQQYKSIKIANVKISTRFRNSKSRRTIQAFYQILYEKQWVYARIREFKEGIFRYKSKDFHFEISTPSRDYPFYDKESIITVDFNNDGIFQRQSVLKGDTIILRETINPKYPFLIGNSNFEISKIDSAGNNLTLFMSDKTESISVGYKAPVFQATNIYNDSLILLPDTSGIELIEFWSIYCPNSEIAHNELKEIVSQYKNKLKYIVIAREDDLKILKKYLDSNPINSDLITSSESGWQIYDKTIATPCFYLIQNKKIIFSDIGYKSIPVLKEILNRLNWL